MAKVIFYGVSSPPPLGRDSRAVRIRRLGRSAVWAARRRWRRTSKIPFSLTYAGILVLRRRTHERDSGRCGAWSVWVVIAMIHARPPRGRPNPRVTMRLPDLALGERESAYFAPRMADWVLLGLLVVVLLGNGLVMWHQLGPANDHTGRAIFFGLALLCALWFALVYTFKLSVSVRIGPHGVGVVRGPWRTELAWSQVARLVERVQVESGQRFRWVVVFAQDGRSMQVREDMVIDFPRFRQEVWERFRLWRDHGGTWGTTGGGAFSARESSSTETLWWLVAGCAALLPGLYFALVLPELCLPWPVLLAFAALCAVIGLPFPLRRQTYNVAAETIESQQLHGKGR